MKAPRVISTFAGIGGFDLGLERAGCEVVAQIEQDANCQRLLETRFPGRVRLGNIMTVPAAALPACDILCGGWPCQDLSVAGLRGGLAGDRSGLFYQFTRLAHDLQPPFLLWENVPGLLSSDEGRDMLRVVTELQRIRYCGAWRTFDAQHFGLAQRRRRVFGMFVRSHLGAERCAQILSLGEGLRGHPAPGRKAGQKATSTLTRGTYQGGAGGGDGRDGLLIAGTLGGSSQSGGFRTTDLDNNGAFIVVGALGDGSRGYTADNAAAGQYVVSGAVTGKWRKGSGGPAGDECQNLVSHALTSKGFNASENGTGRETPIIAFSSKDHGADAGELSPTLRSMNFRASHPNGGGQVAVAFTLHGSDGSSSSATGADVATALRGRAPGSTENFSTTAALDRRGVRRLTPLECERLQGFPDGWTLGFSDSVRYQMLGNAAPPPVIEWIGRRLVSSMHNARTELPKESR